MLDPLTINNVEKNQIEAIPKLSTSDFENMPTWSPDGKYLYFLSLLPYCLVAIVEKILKKQFGLAVGEQIP